MTAIGKVRLKPASQLNAAHAGRSGDGLANAIICMTCMLACVVAYIMLAPW